MEPSDKTGGPAFPVPFSLDHEKGGPVFAELYGNGGMTLRDYFAAKAMQGLMADPNTTLDEGTIAAVCYRIADGMLEARQR